MPPLVILAAGRGRRMGAPSKPLVRLLGLTLLERSVLTFREAGIKKFYVIVGYKKEKVKKHVEEIARKYNVDIEAIESKEWEKGNGATLMALDGIVKKFFLTMADHIFEKSIVENFVKKAANEKCYLAVDTDINSVIDIDEATKVKMDGKRIVNIGKDINDYNGVDMGLFFFNDSIFDALKRAMENGKANLTDGVKLLAESGKLYGIEKEHGFWIDTDNPKNLEIAEKMLISSLSKKEDGFISYNINRKISTKISKKLCITNIKPNYITVLSFLLSIFGGLLFIFSEYLYTAIAGILVQISSIIDGCDGEIARLKFMATPFGAWLDTILDRYADAIISIFITYNGWMIYKNIIVWPLGMLAMLSFLMASYSRKEYELRYGKKLDEGTIDNLSKRDIRLFSIFAGAIINHAFEAMVAISILHHVAIITNFVRRGK